MRMEESPREAGGGEEAANTEGKSPGGGGHGRSWDSGKAMHLQV